MLCLLEGTNSSFFSDMQLITHVTYSLQLENLEHILHIMPEEVGDFDSGTTGFLRIVRREGVFI